VLVAESKLGPSWAAVRPTKALFGPVAAAWIEVQRRAREIVVNFIVFVWLGCSLRDDGRSVVSVMK
jgi:hypothetical protein